jgi:hypothetical protein
MPPASFANYNGRQYPDLVSVGDRILIYADGMLEYSGMCSFFFALFVVISLLLRCYPDLY